MSELSINTTQNVTINFTAASIGHRILAFGVDLLIIIAYLTTIAYTGLSADEASEHAAEAIAKVNP